ncbi:hypothetical protein SAY87_027114 [Trapa incisa]|uniref:NERD domain-containing protein n=1 Tax=Trapa incisa TaxID=236973 RepID=A0AAN7JM85_9MYRT|nr:hypothetical protein SAY87_027114 [Trapa incisa]
MWIEILCGLVIYRLFRRFFFDDGKILSVETSDSQALFSVASRLEKLYGGKSYVGLRIPDPDTGSRQNIDLVLVARGKAVVISVKNLAGFVSVNADGSWSCLSDHKRKTTEHHPNPIMQARMTVSILEEYIQRRGVTLPEGYFSCKVIVPNPKFCAIGSNQFPPEVITYEQWAHMKPESKNMLSDWFRGTFQRGTKEMKESIHQELNFILSTAPMWDRLELKGNKYVLGEFMEFKGRQEDIQALRNVRRSQVGRLIIQKTSMFGLAPSNLHVLYTLRDYRSEGASASEWMEMTVSSSTEILFLLQNSSKVRKFKLSSLVSMSLSV